MTPEQKAAYTMAQAACALAEIEGMKAENMQRELRGESMAYVFDDFFAITEKYPIHHNAVVAWMRD